MIVLCSCGEVSQNRSASGKQNEKVKAVVITAGHGFQKEPFFEIFDSFDNIEYNHFPLKDDSEIFEDISNWDYDVIVLYNMTQQISPKRRRNFLKLLNRGVGVVALHHCIAAFEDWSEYRKIIGGIYFLHAKQENGIAYKPSTYKHDVDFKIHVEDTSHPVTKGMSDFTIHDETYKNCVFEKDNQVLLSTNHPTSDTPLCWVRQYDRARIFYIQMGHGPSAYADKNYRRVVSRAIRWCANKLNEN